MCLIKYHIMKTHASVPVYKYTQRNEEICGSYLCLIKHQVMKTCGQSPCG
jgi:hypothetical protein